MCINTNKKIIQNFKEHLRKEDEIWNEKINKNVKVNKDEGIIIALQYKPIVQYKPNVVF